MEEDEIKYPNYTYDPSLGFDYNKALKADEVKNWQKVLYDGGYYGDNATDKEIDGKFGARSLAATERWLAAQKPATTNSTVETQPTNLDSSEKTEIKPELPDYLKNKEAFADWAGLNAKSKTVSTEQKRKALERQNYASSLADAFKLIVNAAGGSKGMYIDKIPSNPYFQRTAAMRDKLDEFDLQEEVRARNENMMRGLRNSELYLNSRQAAENKMQQADQFERGLKESKEREQRGYEFSEKQQERGFTQQKELTKAAAANQEYLARLGFAERAKQEKLDRADRLEYNKLLLEAKAAEKQNEKVITTSNKNGYKVELSEDEVAVVFDEMTKNEEVFDRLARIFGYGNIPNTPEQIKTAVLMMGQPFINKLSNEEKTKSPITGKTSSVPAGFQ